MHRPALTAVTLLLALLPITRAAPASEPALSTVSVATGLTKPLFVTHAPGPRLQRQLESRQL